MSCVRWWAVAPRHQHTHIHTRALCSMSKHTYHSGESIADAAKHATSSAARTVDPEREDKSAIQKAKEAIGMD